MSGSARPTGSALLERDGDLARLAAALDRARDGGGSFVVVEGPAGMGKTAVLTGSRAIADARGMRVLRGRGAELEREFAFGVVRQLFEPVLASASVVEREDLLKGAAGFAARALGLPGAPSGTLEESASRADWSFAVLHGLYWLCANLASGHPLYIVVDDAHLVDAPSLRYLAFLLPRLEELPVALAVATRTRETAAGWRLLDTITGDSSAEIVRLLPLSRAGVLDFVEEALGAPPEPEFVDACLRATRGTPFMLHELAGALRDEGVKPTAESATHVDRIGAHTIGRSLSLRLSRLSEPAVRLARSVAILERSDLDQAARLAELSRDDAIEAADVLAVAGILDPGRPLRFVHPMVRAGIYEGLSTGTRARGHRSAARLLGDVSDENERVAEHLLASEPAADAWSVDRLVEAARAAARTGAPETASVYLRRALAEPPEPNERPGILLELGMAEASAGLAAWRSHLEAAVEAATDEGARVDAAMVLGLALNRAQSGAAAIEVLDRTASSLDRADQERRVLLEAAAAGVEIANAVVAPGVDARRRAVRGRADADASSPPELLAVAALIAILTNEPASVGAELAHRALIAERDRLATGGRRPWFSYATWFAQATGSLLWAERYDELRPLLDESIAQAPATGDSGRLAIGLALRGWLALRLGDLAAAEVDARTALAASELRAPALYRVLNGGVLVNALVEQGELDAAEAALAPFDREIESDYLAAALLRFGRGRLRIAQGRIDEGLADLLGVGELTTRALVTCPSYLPWRSEAALAYLLVGNHDKAEALADQELELAQAFAAPRALGFALRAAALVAGGQVGEARLRESVALLEHAGARLDLAWSLTELGALIRRANRRSEARELLRQALDTAYRLGARPLARRAETELRATGARPRRIVLTGLESLTASERRVAELAAQNLTNREIAQGLFVTSRTVEGHLTSVFRKLRLASRDELPAALAGDAPAVA